MEAEAEVEGRGLGGLRAPLLVETIQKSSEESDYHQRQRDVLPISLI